MPQSLSNTLVHIVFGTKHRQNFIDDQVKSGLFGILGNACNKLKCRTIIVNGHVDHVHVFCSLHRTVSQSKLVEEIKKESSKWMKQQGEKYEGFYWQDGYAIFSVSQSKSHVIINYIKNQEEHHRSKSFKEEYRELLDLHEVPYKEEFMWD